MSAENDYSTSGDQEAVPVDKDEEVQDQVPEEVDSGAQLQADEEEAIDKSNIIEERTRGGSEPGAMREPGDDEGIPTDDGTSATA